jgi:hypothetical protein
MTDKCAPGKKLVEGSCYTIDNLKDIATAYNKEYNDKIRISNNKKVLLQELTGKMHKRFNCDENGNDQQKCWNSSALIKGINNNDIKYNTFRPNGPRDNNKWLATGDINKVMQQYQYKYKNFKYLGTLPNDFADLPHYEINNIKLDDLEKNNITQLGAVINLDNHNQNGSHWVAFYTNLAQNKVYYFDSVGIKPNKRINGFVRKVLTHMYNKKNNTHFNVQQFLSKYHSSKEYDVRYNKIQHQFKNTECGVYSMNFIIRLLNGKSFDDIVENITKDDDMSKCRKSYFN